MSNSTSDNQEPAPASHGRGLGAHEKPTHKDVHDLLRRGLRAARAGAYQPARRWFFAALEKDPDNIIALLWLAALSPTQRETLALLSRVLELDPANEHAQAGIRWARQRSLAHPDSQETGSDARHPADEPPASTVAPEHSERFQLLRDLLESTRIQENARAGAVAQRARRFIKPWGLLLGVAGCLFVIGVLLVARYSPAAVLAWVLPTPATDAVAPPTSSSEPGDPPPSSPVPIATTTQAASPTPTPTPTGTPVPDQTATSVPTLEPSPVPTAASTPMPEQGEEKWIDVDLTNQWLTAYEGDTPVFEASVSTGLPRTPTRVGEYRIYWKLKASDMAGPGYYLPAVPYTMYYHGGYALHGTYWHNNFGHPMSHGCVNLRTDDAEWLFNWADPPMPAGASHVRSSRANPGTLVVIHK